MQRPKVFKLLTSVFTKLLLIIFIAGMGINLAVIFFFGAIRHHVANNYEPHLTRYVAYLVKDMGTPPSLARARQIAAGTNMVIAYESPETRWHTAAPPFDMEDHEFRIWHKTGDIQVGGYHGKFIINVDQGPGRITFYLPHQKDAEKKIKVITAGLFIYITLLMLAAWFAIRWVLKPLQWLKQGVHRVARGELDHKVPLKGSDELRDLATAFNAMTERLQLLIRSKEQLLLDVSHELRTPITRLKVALALLPEGADKESLEEDLKEMELKISELLETARALKIKASLNYAPEEPDRLIRDVTSRLAAGRPELQIERIPDMPSITIDGAQIRKALKNIMDNAQKYSADDDPPVVIRVSHQPPFAVIAVEDKGIGIPSADLDFIFEPFYRVDKSRAPQTGGYGLGLSLAKTIIEAHGGHIEVSSIPDEGTTVTVFLPMQPNGHNNK